jgi:dGTPase
MLEQEAECPSLWSTARRGGSRSPVVDGEIEGSATDKRSPFEHDYDRLLFSSPVRRLADKTQVFPLDLNDTVRTRLTHSHEVSNLARSLCNRLMRTQPNVFGSELADTAAPVMLACAGLAHDLGNPPFGHQGEVAVKGDPRA